MKKYIEPVLRWWWLIVISAIVAGVSSYLSVSRQPPIYEAHASLIVGRSIRDPNPSSNEFYLEQQLAAIYANVGSMQIAGPTMETLKLKVLPDYIVRPVANTPLIEIVVTDTNPARAQAVANELANQLIKSSPTGKNQGSQGNQISNRQSFINERLDKLQTQIKETDDEIDTTRQKLAETSNARQIADIQTLLTALEQKQTSLQDTYTNLLANTQEGAVNNIEVMQYAVLPVRPVGPNKILYILIAGGIGMALSIATAYGIELIDSRIRTGEEIAQLLETPILGKIPTLPRDGSQSTYTLRAPRSPVTDAFRSLRTNLEFMGVKYPMRTILVSGAEGAEGKSTIAANLALTMAQAEKKVILVEADLRLPSLQNALGVGDEPGISETCLGRVSLENALIPLNRITAMNSKLEGSGSENIQTNNGFSFWFLPAGTVPPNPAELLDSSRFSKILADLTSQADVVIIDSPPLFLPDAAILLSKVDGVLLVFQPRKTRLNAVQAVREQIRRSGVRLLGIVVNQAGANHTYYRYGKYGNAEKPSAKKSRKARLPQIKLPFLSLKKKAPR